MIIALFYNMFMQNSLYRKADLKDLDKLISLKDEVKKEIIKKDLDIWQDDYPNRELLKSDIVNDYGRIITIDEKVVAYMALIETSIDYEGDFYQGHYLLSFSRIMTSPYYRNIGLAKRLIKEAILEAKDRRYDGLAITVDAINERAVSLYRSFGFINVGYIDIPEAKNTLDKYILLF